MRGYILSGREKILDSGNLLRVKVHGGQSPLSRQSCYLKYSTLRCRCSNDAATKDAAVALYMYSRFIFMMM